MIGILTLVWSQYNENDEKWRHVIYKAVWIWLCSYHRLLYGVSFWHIHAEDCLCSYTQSEHRYYHLIHIQAHDILFDLDLLSLGHTTQQPAKVVWYPLWPLEHIRMIYDVHHRNYDVTTFFLGMSPIGWRNILSKVLLRHFRNSFINDIFTTTQPRLFTVRHSRAHDLTRFIFFMSSLFDGRTERQWLPTRPQ